MAAQAVAESVFYPFADGLLRRPAQLGSCGVVKQYRLQGITGELRGKIPPGDDLEAKCLHVLKIGIFGVGVPYIIVPLHIKGLRIEKAAGLADIRETDLTAPEFCRSVLKACIWL